MTVAEARRLPDMPSDIYPYAVAYLCDKLGNPTDYDEKEFLRTKAVKQPSLFPEWDLEVKKQKRLGLYLHDRLPDAYLAVEVYSKAQFRKQAPATDVPLGRAIVGLDKMHLDGADGEKLDGWARLERFPKMGFFDPEGDVRVVVTW